MQNNSKITDTGFTKVLRDKQSKLEYSNSDFECVTLTDFFRGNVFDIIDNSEAYLGLSILGERSFLDNAFSTNSSKITNSGFLKNIKQIEKDINLVNGYINLIESNPIESIIFEIRGELIMKSDELKYQIIQARTEKCSELKSLMINKQFIDNVIDCLGKDNISSIISHLKLIKSSKESELSFTQSSFSRIRKNSNFVAGNYNLHY